MPAHAEIDTRMKNNYEIPARSYLTRRTPVIIRIDGKAFHTFTRGFEKPYDRILMYSMQETMKYLCENIQGCVLGYTQSDEISLLLVDYKNFDTSAWFDYQVMKVCSIAASMATLAFNREFADNVEALDIDDEWPRDEKLMKTYKAAVKKGACFDARCFNIPKEEVTNYFYSRQIDATRNSIQMAGQAYFSHKELMNKSTNMIQDMLITEKGINWNDYFTDMKRGSCCIKTSMDIFNATANKVIKRTYWTIDTEIPIFIGKDRDYIDKLCYIADDIPVASAN